MTLIFKDHNVKGTFYSNLPIQKILSRTKDKRPLEQQSNVGYQILYNDCDAVYIGETKWKFHQCVHEHMLAVRNTDTLKLRLPITVGIKIVNLNGMKNKL